MNKVVLKEKFDNYWYYYKTHTLVGIFVIFVVVYTIATSIGTKAPALNINILGNYIDDAKKITLQEEATKLFVTDPKKEVFLNFYLFNKDNPDEMTGIIVQKIMAEVQAKELDVLIADRETFEAYANQGLFMRLDTINELPGLTSGNLKLVNAKVEDVDTQEYPYGIEVDDNEVLKGTDYDTKGKVLGIIVNTERRELTLNFLKWLLKL